VFYDKVATKTMPSIAKEIFTNIFSIFSNILLFLFFVGISLVYTGYVNLSSDFIFYVSCVGYVILTVLGIAKGVKRKHKAISNTGTADKTLYLTHQDMMAVEFYAFFASFIMLMVFYWSNGELKISNVFQSFMVLVIVKIVNWFYFSKEV
jgi:hypothetical protein